MKLDSYPSAGDADPRMAADNNACSYSISIERLERLPVSTPVYAVWIRLSFNNLALTCGPWRVAAWPGYAPEVLPPDPRFKGQWVQPVKFPEELARLVGDALVSAIREREGRAR